MFVHINNASLKIEVLGDAAVPITVIAHHGAPGLSAFSEPKAAFGSLAKCEPGRYRVMVFDARGSGESEYTSPESYTHEQWTADINAIREWAGVEKIVMAGVSYGGFLSLEYAIRYPDTVSALVLRDTAADSMWLINAREHAKNSDRVNIDMEIYDRIFEGRLRDNEDLGRGIR